MVKVRIIPCLDVDNGRVVKGINFLNLIDAGDPVEQAKIYSSKGADEITFLDITATHEKREAMLDVITKTAEEVFVPLTVGGGIKNIEDIQKFLMAGADKVSLNSSAVKNPRLIKDASKVFGNQCIVVAIDAKRKNDSWNVFTHGGRVDANLNALEWAKEAERLGAGEILLTSMDRDGTKQGFDLELTRVISNSVNIPVVASGGVGSLNHFYEGIKIGNASAVLAASVFHFNKISIMEVKKFLNSNGINVRL